MESTNLHHLQDHPPPLHPSSLSTPSCFGVGFGTTHSSSWTPNTTLDGGNNLDPSFQEANPTSPRSRALKDSNMIEGLSSYEWGSGGAGSCLSNECDDNHSDLHYSSSFSKIKEEEMSDMNGFPKFTEMLNTTSTMDLKDFNALSDKLLLKTLSSGDFFSNNNTSTSAPSFASNTVGGAMGMGSIVATRGSFSQIYPSINISNLNNHSSSPPTVPISTSLDINMQCSDLLASSASFNGTQGFTHSSQSHDGLIPRFNHNLPFRLHHMQQPIHRSSSSCSSSNPSHFTNVMAETKRPNSTLMESKASQSQTVPKKSRLESRSSCPPFKVRKEKLGDRIAALQQLVAPFGKTDTASVLMEAIGYIKFLQNQVETLSVPYMKSSRKKTNRAMQGVSGIEEGKEEAKLDLRSRGLCLVPLSCMSYFTGDGASGVWQQSDHFGGAT